jgi:hypothetical protein
LYNQPTCCAGIIAIEGTELYFYAWSVGGTSKDANANRVWEGTKEVYHATGSACTKYMMRTVTCPGADAWVTKSQTPPCTVTLSELGVTVREHRAILHTVLPSSSLRVPALASFFVVVTATVEQRRPQPSRTKLQDKSTAVCVVGGDGICFEDKLEPAVPNQFVVVHTGGYILLCSLVCPLLARLVLNPGSTSIFNLEKLCQLVSVY